MYCKKCDTRLKCNNSAEENNIRYRQYACPNCKEKFYTCETEAVPSHVESELAFIASDKRQYKQLRKHD